MRRTTKPALPGTIIDELYLKPLKLNKKTFAEALKISRNTLYKILDGRARITADLAVRLSKALNTSVELWLNLQQKCDIWDAQHEISYKRASKGSHSEVKSVIPLAAKSR